MKSTEKLAGAVARILLAYLLVFSPGVWAAQDSKPSDAAKPAQKSAAEQPREKASSAGIAKAEPEEAQGEASGNAASAEKLAGDGKHEGIKVHGHWTIEVKNPDGTLVTHREFENSLTSQGGGILTNFLARAYSVGFWSVAISGATGPCLDSSSTPTPCWMNEPGWGAPTAFYFNTLGVSATGGGFVLNGTAVAAVSGPITVASTWVGSCPATTPVSTPCPGIASGLFTSATLATPISVSAGQTIAVTVAISFS